jgi:flagellar motor switch protein FliN
LSDDGKKLLGPNDVDELSIAASADDAPFAGDGFEELDLRIELGRAELATDEVAKLREGSVVPLDKLAGDPVDILVGGRLVARGEVLVLSDSFGVRVAEILAPCV